LIPLPLLLFLVSSPTRSDFDSEAHPLWNAEVMVILENIQSKQKKDPTNPEFSVVNE
jgi:hypothetical protein